MKEEQNLSSPRAADTPCADAGPSPRSPREISAVVVMRYDLAGDLSIHIADPDGSCIVLTVDERCPDDLVYEHLGRQPAEDVLALAPRPWGSCDDDRHGQVTARVLRLLDGLTVIDGGLS